MGAAKRIQMDEERCSCSWCGCPTTGPSMCDDCAERNREPEPSAPPLALPTATEWAALEARVAKLEQQLRQISDYVTYQVAP